jgi:large subunit ribosomal protein L21e
MGKSKGFRRKSRSILKKNVREKGKLPLSRLLTNYVRGEEAVIKIDPAVHKGMPHKRYHGKVAKVIGTRGKAYILEIKQRRSVKKIITTPHHLRKHLAG